MLLYQLFVGIFRNCDTINVDKIVPETRKRCSSLRHSNLNCSIIITCPACPRWNGTNRRSRKKLKLSKSKLNAFENC